MKCYFSGRFIGHGECFNPFAVVLNTDEDVFVASGAFWVGAKEVCSPAVHQASYFERVEYRLKGVEGGLVVITSNTARQYCPDILIKAVPPEG